MPAPLPPPLPELLPVPAAARELGVRPWRVHDFVTSGRLHGVYPTPRRMFLRRSEVAALKAARGAHETAVKRAAATGGLTAAAVAKACNVEVATVRRWIALGRLRATKAPVAAGFLQYRITRADFDAFVAGESTR